MRRTAAALNRGWLTVLGLVLLLAGGCGTVVTTGQARPLAAAAGWSLPVPEPGSPVFGPGWDAAWLPVLAAVAGIGAVLLAAAWLVALIPRRAEAKTFRLQDSAETGLTRCEPAVLTAAVEAHTNTLPDVVSTSAVLRGDATRPELSVQVTAADRADLVRLVAQISTTVAGGVNTALDTRLHRLGVQIEISRTARTSDAIRI